MSAEAELIRRCKAGDARAYEPLVRAYEGPAVRVATGLLGDADDARDAVQDAFVRAFGALPRFDAGRPFFPWFLQILRNRCLDVLRARRPSFGLEVLDTGADADAQSRPGPEEQRRSARAKELVWQGLAHIGAEHREVLVLKELEGLSYAEIAQATGVPEGTVASRLYHARRALRGAIEAIDRTGAWTEVAR